MEARYALRKSQLLDECQIAPEIFEQVIPRLSTFMKPFVRIFQGQAANSLDLNGNSVFNGTATLTGLTVNGTTVLGDGTGRTVIVGDGAADNVFWFN